MFGCRERSVDSVKQRELEHGKMHKQNLCNCEFVNEIIYITCTCHVVIILRIDVANIAY